jgi:hypothetical protein
MAEETTQDPPDATYTTATRTLHSRVRLLWVFRVVIGALVLGAVVGIAGFVTDRGFWPGGVVFALAFVLGVVHTILLYRSWTYEVRADALYLQRGVLTLVKTIVPNVRVQHIDVQRNPAERLLGLSSLVVYTAGSRGADVTVPGLTPAEATDLQERLKALTIDAEEDAV